MTRLNQHLEYKASGVDWLGHIPSHWEMVKLKNGFDLQKRPAIKSAGIVTAFRDGQVTLRSNRRVDGYTEGDKQMGYQTICPGDLVIHAMDAFAGAIGVSDSYGQSTPVYSACTPKPGYNAYFYARALRHIALTGYITSLAKGVRERSTDFRWADAKELPVPKPPVEEQDAIVSFLDRETAQIDGLIGKQERLIELLAEKRRAIITHAVSNSAAEFPQSKLRYHIQLNPPVPQALKSQPEAHRTFLPMNAVGERGEIDLSVSRSVEDLLTGYSYFEDLDVSFAKVTPCFENGKGAVFRDLSSGQGFGTTELTVMRCGSSLSPEYLYLLTQSDLFRKNGVAAMTGAGGLKRVPDDFVRSFNFRCPSLETQTSIVASTRERLNAIDVLVQRARSAMALLSERRSALISAAVTGKINVKAEELLDA